MDWQPLGVVNYSNFVYIDRDKGSNYECHFNGFQQNLVHDFCDPLAKLVNPMFLRDKFHFQ